ncbi:MAG: DUF3667 domain-containing protein [Ignavibacteriae bacterium]|nr:DUF3667 domain-containing protein [Ignavibacteriota bacterium]
MKSCVNCGVESTDKFCPACGQEISVKRLEVKTIIKDVTHGILHWENSILNMFRLLLVYPGTTAKNYVSGIRKSYMKPFSYFIFLQTIFVILFHWTSGKYFAFINLSFTPQSALHSEFARYQQIINSYINYFNYFMPLFFALYFYLFFKKQLGINYAESIACAFYWIGTTLVFGIILMSLSFLDVRIRNIRIVINLIFLTFAIVQYSKTSNFKTISKSILVIVLSYITFILFIGVVLTQIIE